MKKLLLFLILNSCFLTLFALQANAESFSLSINPPVAQIIIKPGKSITNVFTIKNLANIPQTFTVRLIPFTSGDTWGNPHLLPSHNPDWLKYFSLVNSDISLDEPFEIGANTSQQLVLSLSVPDNAPLTDHYATLLVTQTTPPAGDLENTRLSGSIGANILLSINTTDLPSSTLSISGFSISPSPLFKIGNSFVYDNLETLLFEIKAKNPNSHLIQAKGFLKITSGDSVIFFRNLLPTYLLANSERYITASGSSTLSFKPALTNIGNVNASLNLFANTASTNTQITLILLPIKALLGLITTVLILLAIFTKRPKPTP